MKTMKVALLATAALAAVTVSARADDTAAIKAQLEALTARIAQLEASPAVPVGYSLLTISEGPATVVPGLEETDRNLLDTATIIGIMPTADMPASTTIEWSGYVRSIVSYTDYGYDDGDEDVNVKARAYLKVVGKTDTAVGEVGARVAFESNAAGVDVDPAPATVEYWGWWAMTPELTLGGGNSGSLGSIGYGVDSSCSPCGSNDFFSAEQRDEDNISFAPNPGDATQIRLSWASGPVSAAVALEDSDYDGGVGDLGVAGEIKYSGDTISGEISGIWYEHDDGGDTAAVAAGAVVDDPLTLGVDESLGTPGITTSEDGTGWQIGAGAGFALGDVASLSVSATLGDEPSKGDYWTTSALLGFTLTDTVRTEFGASYADYDDLDVQLTEFDVGLYYEPVAQLTLGVEAAWADGLADFYGFEDELITVGGIAVWRF